MFLKFQLTLKLHDIHENQGQRNKFENDQFNDEIKLNWNSSIQLLILHYRWNVSRPTKFVVGCQIYVRFCGMEAFRHGTTLELTAPTVLRLSIRATRYKGREKHTSSYSRSTLKTQIPKYSPVTFRPSLNSKTKSLRTNQKHPLKRSPGRQ